jgi:hypothetical protein
MPGKAVCSLRFGFPSGRSNLRRAAVAEAPFAGRFMKQKYPTAARRRRPSCAAVLRCGIAAGLLAGAAAASACEAQAPAAGEARAVKSWVVSLNPKVPVAARCGAMAEAVSRMVAAGSMLRISIFGYEKPEGSRSLSLAYLAAVTDELRSLLHRTSKGQARIRTVFVTSADGDAADPEAAGRIEVRIDGVAGMAGG